MSKTNRSLYYLAAYLLAAGVFLVLVPGLALRLLFTSGQYGDVLPRLLGVVLFALGVVIVQIIRHHLEVLYLTTVLVRLVILIVLAGLFVYTSDPLFLSLFAIVGLGVMLTTTCIVLDRRQQHSLAAATR